MLTQKRGKKNNKQTEKEFEGPLSLETFSAHSACPKDRDGKDHGFVPAETSVSILKKVHNLTQELITFMWLEMYSLLLQQEEIRKALKSKSVL